jgi:D-alanine--poly(phosphoribitol) ligase subunit 1
LNHRKAAGASTTDILRIIDDWGRSTPDRVAHVSGARQITYGELRRRSDAVAAYLQRTLPDDGSPVAVLGHKEPEMLIGFIGSVKAAHPYVPIDSVLPPRRIERIVAAAGCAVVLQPQAMAALPERGDGFAGRWLGASDPYYVMFTSGSTGEPKGVVVTLGGLTSFLEWLLAEHVFEKGETFLNQVSYSFDVSIMDTYAALLTGGTVFSITQDDVSSPKQLYQSLRASGVTTWVSTPSFADMCLAERSFDSSMLPRVRRFLFCGEALPKAVASQLLDRFPHAEVWNTYGPTETTVATTSIKIDRDLLVRDFPLPIGRPMPGTRIVIVDESGHPVPAGERGEIVIAGPNVSPGYLGRADLTARAFFELEDMRAYRTGDWGHYRDDLLFCDGRMDGQIKLRGYRIELGDVEANLREVAGVRDAVVLAVLKENRADSLAAFVILSERPTGSDFDIAHVLRTRLAERLPLYMLPRRFIFLERFPMTTNGKTDRRQLAALLA